MYPQLTHPRSGEFVGDGCLKERDVYIKKSILGETFIGEGRLKDRRSLLEKIRYKKHCKKREGCEK